MTTPAIKITAILGGLILIVGASYHMTGLDGAKAAVANIESDFFKKTLPVMWTLPSVHWAFIGFLSIGMSRYKSKAVSGCLYYECGGIITTYKRGHAAQSRAKTLVESFRLYATLARSFARF